MKPTFASFEMKHGELIKKSRKLAGLTQQELANKLNLTQNYIALIESNKRIPSADTFLKICELLDIPDEEFKVDIRIRNDVKALLDRLGADDVVKNLKEIIGEDRLNEMINTD